MDIASKDSILLRKRYDMLEGLGGLCQTLEGMHEAMKQRRRMKEQLGMPLHEFLVAHTWVLDSRGSIYRLQPGFDIQEYLERKLSLVVSTDWVMKQIGVEEEFMDHFLSAIKKDSFSEKRMPRPWNICPVCGEGWHVRNKYDALAVPKNGMMALDNHVGKTYGELKQHFEQDLKDPDKVVEIIGLGPLSVVNTDRRIKKGDTCIRTVTKFYHPDCLKKDEKAFSHLLSGMTSENASPKAFINLLNDAGYKVKGIRPCTDPCLIEHPHLWFEIETTLAAFAMGWNGGVFFIVVLDQEGLDLERLGLDEFNLGCDLKGKALFENTHEEAKKGLSRIREHFEALKST